jgi:uncharacterized membrane protein YqiK
MSQAEPAVPSQADRIEALLIEQAERQERMAEALNGLGQNLQWVFDQAGPILQMLPSMMPAAMAGMMPQMGETDD